MLYSVDSNSSVQVNLNNSTVETLDGRLRLLITLNRYIDGVGRRPRQNPAELDSQDAAILTAVRWGEDHPECLLNQEQMSALLKVGSSGASEKLTKLRRKGFCRLLTESEKEQLGIFDNRSNFFYLTPEGTRALANHTSAYDIRSEDYAELRRTTEYQFVTNRTNEILEQELTQRFLEVRR